MQQQQMYWRSWMSEEVQAAPSGADVVIVSAGMHDIFEPYIEAAQAQLAKI